MTKRLSWTSIEADASAHDQAQLLRTTVPKYIRLLADLRQEALSGGRSG
jgi:hypothetical protein